MTEAEEIGLLLDRLGRLEWAAWAGLLMLAAVASLAIATPKLLEKTLVQHREAIAHEFAQSLEESKAALARDVATRVEALRYQHRFREKKHEVALEVVRAMNSVSSEVLSLAQLRNDGKVEWPRVREEWSERLGERRPALMDALLVSEGLEQIVARWAVIVDQLHERIAAQHLTDAQLEKFRSLLNTEVRRGNEIVASLSRPEP